MILLNKLSYFGVSIIRNRSIVLFNFACSVNLEVVLSNDLLEYQEDEWESVELAADELLEEFKFFAPSLDLAREILRLNDELGDAYFNGEYEEIAAREGIARHAKEPIKYGIWFRWLFRKVSGIVSHDGAKSARGRIKSEDEAVPFISERIFNHLAMLSRSPHAKKGKPFSIREELTKEIAEKLGLGLILHEKTSPLLRARGEEVLLQLAREFQRWFIDERAGRFTTLWGDMGNFNKAVALELGNSCSLLLIPNVAVNKAEAYSVTK